jgi:hypothetical protein
MKTFLQHITEFAIRMPDSKQSLGVPRVAMPQIEAEDYGELFLFLKNHGVTYHSVKVLPSELRSTQKEFKDAGVVKALVKEKIKKPLLISNDFYVVDGHHRWLAAMNTRGTLEAIQFNTGIVRLLALVKKFPKVTYKGLHP